VTSLQLVIVTCQLLQPSQKDRVLLMTTMTMMMMMTIMRWSR
jgi:hypothetical protein